METEIAIDLVEGDWGTVIHRKGKLVLVCVCGRLQNGPLKRKTGLRCCKNMRKHVDLEDPTVLLNPI